ncbi:MAG: pilus assembly protein N-terminal domain-containing protein [bacterium]
MDARSRASLRFCVIAIALLGFSTAAMAAAKKIRVGVGQSVNINTPKKVVQVHVINPRVTDVVRYTSKGATIVGITGGVTEIHFTLSNGRVYKVQVQVSKQQVSQLLQAVKDFMGPVEGVYPRMFGDLVIIDGRALTAGDYGRVMKAVKLFGEKRIKNFAGYQPSAVAEINKTLQAAGLNTVKANLYSGMVYLEGAVGSATEQTKVKMLIQNMDLKVVDLITVGKGRQVLVEVKFVELVQNTDIKFGLELPAAITASGSIIGQIGIQPSGGASNNISLQLQTPETAMSLQMKMLFKRGFARMLAKPKLVCGSGGNAKFMVGGEVPIVSCTPLGACSVEFKEYGVVMKLQPIADSRGNITASLEAEVSELDWSVVSHGIPGFITRRVKTTVTMQEGSTLVLSGLYKNTGSKTTNKIPILGHIPILGELFKSREFQRGKTQLAIFITPRIINPQHPWVRRTIKTFERRYDRFKSKIEWELFD